MTTLPSTSTPANTSRSLEAIREEIYEIGGTALGLVDQALQIEAAFNRITAQLSDLIAMRSLDTTES